MKKRKKITWAIAGMIFVATLVVTMVGVGVFLNRQWLSDFWRGMEYQESEEMAEISGRLGLTERGEFLLRAARPQLMDSDEFNEHCRDDETEAVLGCYAEGDIYVYNVEAPELMGIREVTVAHELLHAVWARMDETERNGLIDDLRRVEVANGAVLGDELSLYDDTAVLEELYVRAGTEVRDLPEALERHYAEIFVEQDVVVGLYEGYIGVFRQMEVEINALMGEIETMKVQMDEEMAEYERRAEQLKADVVSFNSCAEVAGCFKSEEVFNARRGGILAEQEALRQMFDTLNARVEAYNTLVDRYNADVIYARKLRSMINSNVVPEVEIDADTKDGAAGDAGANSIDVGAGVDRGVGESEMVTR